MAEAIFKKLTVANNNKVNDIAGQSIDVGRSVLEIHGKHLRVFQTASSSRACSTASSTGKVRRCKTNVYLKRMKWPLTPQDSDLVNGGPGSQKTCEYDEQRPSTSLLTVSGTNSLSG